MSFQTRQKGASEGASGVESLNGLGGTVLLSSVDSTVTITPDGGTNSIDLSTAKKLERKFSFNFSTTFPLSLGTYLATDQIKTVDVYFKTAFNSGIQFSIGSDAQQELLVSKASLDAETTDTVFSIDLFFTLGTNTELKLFVTGTPTQGTGEIFVDVI